MKSAVMRGHSFQVIWTRFQDGSPLVHSWKKKPRLPKGVRQADEPALRDGEHGADAAIEVVRDAGRLVDHEQAHAGERPDRRFFAGQRHDARLVLSIRAASGSAGLSRPAARPPCRSPRSCGKAPPIAAATATGAGRGCRGVKRAVCSARAATVVRLARLPRAVQEHLPGAGEQELPLPGVRRDAPSTEDLRRVQC